MSQTSGNGSPARCVADPAPLWSAELLNVNLRGANLEDANTLENLNSAADTLVQAVSRPGLRMDLDHYHAQIGEGNLIELVRNAYALGLIGEIQVADVPRPPRTRHRRDRLPRRSPHPEGTRLREHGRMKLFAAQPDLPSPDRPRSPTESRHCFRSAPPGETSGW